jgi:phosphatidylethanolamine-binding protein (PEBP) family uncharacterized protein
MCASPSPRHPASRMSPHPCGGAHFPKEIVIICDDPDAPTHKPFVHWVIYKIPADQKGLPEDGTSTPGTSASVRRSIRLMAYPSPERPKRTLASVFMRSGE